MGIATRMPTDPAVLLLAEANSLEELYRLNDFANRQTYRSFRIGVQCPQDVAVKAGSLSSHISVLQLEAKADWFTEQSVNFPIAGCLSPRSHYGDHYLRDLTNASFYEPNAVGWAKARVSDHFAYGQPTALCGALWRTAEFLKQVISTKPEATVVHPELYLADSDQFQHAGVVNVPLGA